MYNVARSIFATGHNKVSLAQYFRARLGENPQDCFELDLKDRKLSQLERKEKMRFIPGSSLPFKTNNL